jgi:hypothetical protein
MDGDYDIDHSFDDFMSGIAMGHARRLVDTSGIKKVSHFRINILV